MPVNPPYRPGRRADRGDARSLGGGRRRDHRARCRHHPRCPGAERRGAAGRDPRHQRGSGNDHHRRDGPGYEQVPHRCPTSLLGRAVPVRPPVRAPDPGRKKGPGQRLPARQPRPGRGAPPSAQPARTRSSASGTTGSPAAAAKPKPRSPWPGPS